jgi:hypothetical protein
VENPTDNMTVWISNKVIHIISVDKNPMLIILMYMWINKLGNYDSVVECDDNSCSIRYSKSGGTLGLLRYTYVLGWGKRIKQDIILIKEMDINNLIGDVMLGESLNEDMAEYITTIIRMDATQKIKDHLTNMGE